HTVDQPSGGARHPPRLGVPRASQGALAIRPAIGAPNAFVPVHLIENRTKHLDRSEIFAPIARQQLRNRQEGGIILWRFGDDAMPSVRGRSYLTTSILWPGLAGVE